VETAPSLTTCRQLYHSCSTGRGLSDHKSTELSVLAFYKVLLCESRIEPTRLRDKLVAWTAFAAWQVGVFRAGMSGRNISLKSKNGQRSRSNVTEMYHFWVHINQVASISDQQFCEGRQIHTYRLTNIRAHAAVAAPEFFGCRGTVSAAHRNLDCGIFKQETHQEMR